MRIGNVQGARELLEPAGARSAEALSELARTYDPVELGRFTLVAPGTANPTRAVELYTEAAAKGSSSAKARLDRLQQHLRTQKK